MLFKVRCALSSRFGRCGSCGCFPFISLFRPSNCPVPYGVVGDTGGRAGLFALFTKKVEAVPGQAPVAKRGGLVDGELVRLHQRHRVSRELLTCGLRLHKCSVSGGMVAEVRAGGHCIASVRLGTLARVFSISCRCLVRKGSVLRPWQVVRARIGL